MYLRKIVLRGFKSFGRKTVSLRFSKGLTAVVGANGSGKSNVLDAICFTLGILSAKFVRAGSFSDLIYNPASSSTEKPADYSRVTLHFDNSDRKIPIDSDDLVMSRQVDRQGHGAYRLNGRLTTRTELLDILSMVGIDPEGYNIVPQGELARIIRLSPEERKELIEKIAGIATYDEKKERALKELEEVNQNLQRINDKVKMAKDELDRLEKEKEDAVRWQQADNEIKNLQASLIHAELTRAKTNLQEALKSLDAKNAQLGKLKLEEETAAKNHEDLSNRTNEIEPAVVSRESELDGIQSRILESRQQISENENASNYVQEKVESNLSRLKSLQEKSINIKKAVENTSNDIKTFEDRRKVLLKGIEDTTATVKLFTGQISELDGEFGKKRKQLEEIVANINELKSELSQNIARQQLLEKEKTYLGQEITRLRQTKEESNKNSSIAKNDMVTLKNEQVASIDHLSDSKAELVRDEQELSSVRKQLEETDAIIKRIRDELIRIRAKMDAIRETRMFMSHGRRAAIKDILKLKDQKSYEGICGTIGDLIEVPDEYSTAVEASAGFRLTYVVTKSEDDAARLIEYLKKAKTGRASFLPLDALKARIPTKYPKSEGVMGLISDLIKFNKEYEAAIDYVFGNTLLVKDLAVARSLKNSDLRRVTLEGDVVEPAGLITGGFYRKGKQADEKSSLIRLEEELKGLEATRKTLYDKIRTLTKTTLDLRESINIDEKKLEVAAVKLTEKSNRTKELDQIAQNAQTELNSKNKRLEEVIKDSAEPSETIRKLEDNLSAISSQEKKLRALLDTSEASKIGDMLKEKEKELTQLNGELRKVEISIAQSTTKIDQLTPQGEETKKLIDEITSAIPSLQSDLDSKQTKLNVLNEELKSVTSQRDKTKEEVDSLKKKLNENRTALRDSSKNLNAIKERTNQIKMDINGFNIRKESLESEISSAEKRIQEYPEFQSLSNRELNERETIEKVRRFKEEQAALGHVNMKAIEQHDTVKGNYDEIISKRDKVQDEKKSILEFMEKIEREKLKIFTDTFNDISNNFREIFNYLSPTIRAELVLENTDQPLLGGIAIKVRTTNMEVANIEALSGGEKSLTALALTFAIQKHQPAPFYVMDEIDAFLDEVNAVRVADLLKELSKNSQFIVVTLKQALMTRADSLVGVSRNAETGVSNIVSADIGEMMKTPAS
ncbi:MAG: chromosome segregation protein SMC [Candidatus Atabeyarchaeum deiterrae]